MDCGSRPERRIEKVGSQRRVNCSAVVDPKQRTTQGKTGLCGGDDRADKESGKGDERG